MRSKINSLNTMVALSESFKDLVAKLKAFGDKITINNISEHCGVNRNTFYYHFTDINALIVWTLQHDLGKIRASGCHDGKQIRDFMIHYLDNNRKFLLYAFQQMGFDFFRNAYIGILSEIISDYVNALEKQSCRQLNENFKEFAVDFFAESVGTLIVWYFRKPDKFPREAAARALDATFIYAIPDMLSHENDINSSYAET